MKVINVEISVKKYTEISVVVPDDFEVGRIAHFNYGGVLAEAAKKSWCHWDEPFGEPAEVESYKELGGDELAKEIAEYGAPIDIRQMLTDEIERQNAMLAERAAHGEK